RRSAARRRPRGRPRPRAGRGASRERRSQAWRVPRAARATPGAPERRRRPVRSSCCLLHLLHGFGDARARGLLAAAERRRDRAEGREEGLLIEVVRAVARPDEAQRVHEDLALVALDELAESESTCPHRPEGRTRKDPPM